jgi:hypothetical protein
VLLREGLAAPLPIDQIPLSKALAYLTCLSVEQKAQEQRARMNKRG